MPSAAAKTKDPLAIIVRMVDDRADQFRSLLGDDPRMFERFRTVALHAITSNPKLLEADPLSIIEAIRDSATMGLEPNGLLGEGAIVPYFDRRTNRSLAQFQPGWQGLLKLARRSDGIKAIGAQVVYANDEFHIELGSDPNVTHRPALSNRGTYIGAYSYARLASDELDVEWMPLAEIEQARKQSKNSDKGPWVDWWSEMARKTVLRRHLKRLPKSTTLERALELEAHLDQADRPDPRPRALRPEVAAVRAKLGITSGPVPDPDVPTDSEDDDPEGFSALLDDA